MEAPQCLIITLQRFSIDSQRSPASKIFTEVTYDQNLTLPIPYPQISHGSQNCENYTLVSAIVHSGASVDTGHYYAYGRYVPSSSSSPTNVDNRWYKLDDNDVKQSSFGTLKDDLNKKHWDTAYVLMYQKMGTKEKVQLEQRDIKSHKQVSHSL